MEQSNLIELITASNCLGIERLYVSAVLRFGAISDQIESKDLFVNVNICFRGKGNRN